MIQSWNQTIAVTPFKTNEVTTDKTKYYAAVDAKNALEGLQVLFGTKDIPAGSVVYVHSEMKKAAWAQPQQTVQFEGQPLIFLPLQDIRLVKLPQYQG